MVVAQQKATTLEAMASGVVARCKSGGGIDITTLLVAAR